MSVTVVIGKRHLLAGLSLLLLTALIGVALVVPAVSDATTTYVTRSASCPGVSFYPANSANEYATSGIERSNLSSATENFRCNAELPNGAIVTKVQFLVDGGEACYLIRYGLQMAGDYTYMAGPLTNNGGSARLTSTTITDATINNANNAYVLECSLAHDSGTYGADVIYKITAAKG